jgi:hypothetical protein
MGYGIWDWNGISANGMEYGMGWDGIGDSPIPFNMGGKYISEIIKFNNQMIYVKFVIIGNFPATN